MSDKPQQPGKPSAPEKSSAPGKPLWRQAYDAVDTRVAPQLESLVQTKQFAQVLSLGLRAQNEAWRAVERRSRQFWHLVNLPAGSDVTRLREQVVNGVRLTGGRRIAVPRNSPSIAIVIDSSRARLIFPPTMSTSAVAAASLRPA